MNKLFFYDRPFLALPKIKCSLPSLAVPEGSILLSNWFDIMVKSLTIFLIKVTKIF